MKHGGLSVNAILLGTVASLVTAKKLVRGAEHTSMPKVNTPSNVRTRSERMPYELVYRQCYRHGRKFYPPDVASNPAHVQSCDLSPSPVYVFHVVGFFRHPTPQRQTSNAFLVRYYDNTITPTHGGASSRGIVPRNPSIRIQFVQLRHAVT